jgi:hypothetical protein
LFAQNGVDLVFSAHDHGYERSVVTGTTYIVTAGGGAPMYAHDLPNPYSVYITSTLHVISLTLNGDTLSVVGVRPDGVTFDPFTLTRRKRS